MLLGLFRRRYRNKDSRGSASSLVHLLWSQGLVWLFIATVAYVPPVVLISLNLNASYNMMFQYPSLVALSIAATRMYRSLTDFHSHGVPVSPTQKRDLVASEASRIRVAPTSPNRMEVVVHTECERYCEQYPVSPTSYHSSLVSKDEQLCDKPQGANVEAV